MSQYLILLYEDEAGYATADEAVMKEVLDAHNAFGEKNGKAIAGGNALQPTSTATTVRPDGAGGFTVTDGPFVETKEHIGGFAVVDVPDEEAARLWAGKIAVACGWPQEVHRFQVRREVS